MNKINFKVLIIIFVFFAFGESNANKLSVSAAEPANRKMTRNVVQKSCQAKGLKQKDCPFLIESKKVRIWHDKIFLTTSRGHDLKPVDIPKAADWEFIRYSKVGLKDLIEVAVWTEPVGVGDVSSLIWSVYEINESEIMKRVQVPIQKRKRNAGQNKFSYDPQVRFGIQTKGQETIWFADKENGSFK